MGSSARNYSWPAFTAGNAAALRHGADSPRRVSPLADALAADAVDQAPWLSRPSFAAALAAWSRSEARALLVHDYLDQVGLLDDDGAPRTAATYLERLEATAARRRAELGLTPAAFATLLATFAGTQGGGDVLERLKAEGKAIVDSHQTGHTPVSAALPAGDDQ